MSSTDEWGPWIEHDGSGCPCKGSFVHVGFALPGGEVKAIALNGESWFWTTPDYCGATRLKAGKRANPIIRYRIRKPRGMAVLETVMENLNAPIVEGAE